MSEQKQLRYSDKEMSVIKSSFSDGNSNLFLLRKIFLQNKLTDDEVETVKKLANQTHMRDIITKTFTPKLDIDAPINQVIDLWLTVDNSAKTPAETRLALKVRERLLEMLNAGVDRFVNPTPEGSIKIIDYAPDFNSDDEGLYVEFMARNALISHSEFHIGQLKILAGSSEETVEETKERLEKNSNK